MRDCLTLAEQAATSGTDRGAARQYAQQAARYISVVKRLPALEVDPPGTLNCGSADVGAQSTCQVTINSTGAMALHITGAEVTGGNSDDFTAGGECAGQWINPGQNCTMTIQFQPSGAGERDATLVIHQNLPPPDHGTTLQLTGTGTGTGTTTPPGGHLLTVTVQASSAAMAWVTSNPTGITNCRSVCTATFDDSTDITLTIAYVQRGGQVTWYGCDTASGDTCTIRLTMDRPVTVHVSAFATPSGGLPSVNATG